MIVKKNYQLHEKDSGSAALQIISLRKKIRGLGGHLQGNKKDIPAARALKKKLAKEKSFFKYLKRHNPGAYEKLKKELK
ncbi:MAG: 30S ribosomal protein S15 [Mycoplasmataceae bacterium RV_VA103A]|nr:MAG: 30S ribosomal protein S15 [Mycoplasmataceae bacterium RV_VA103A]